MTTPTSIGFPSKVYNAIINSVDKFVPAKLRPLWVHPAGPKTVFFWAPVFKWTLVLASIGDFARPADQLSMAQSGALAATGIIWSRYSVIIIPRNYGLLSVNIFLFFANMIQVGRAYKYQLDQKAKESADK